MDITTATAEKVRAAIDSHGETIKSTSDKSGVPYVTLHRKTKGPHSTPFTVRELGQIAEALGIHYLELLPAKEAA